MPGGAPKGNKNAAKAKYWEAALKRALAGFGGGDMEEGIHKIAKKVVELAGEGNQWAVIEIGTRLDGKPAQIIETDGEGEVQYVIAVPVSKKSIEEWQQSTKE